jgi:ParB-like chromosome segregation protein Spo0J
MKNILITQIAVEETRLTHQLAKAVAAKGVIVPVVLAIKKNASGLYSILDGRRRILASIKAGFTDVPAIFLDGGPEITLLLHATRRSNPVSELKAVRTMMEQGMSEAQIARAGYVAVQRIRKLAKLNRLAPEIACRVEKGEVSTTVAFEIAAYLTPESQRELAQEEKITGGLVHKYRSAGREQKELNGLQVIEQPKSATMDEMLGELSVDTLQAIMADLPTGQHFAIWRAKVARAMSLLSVELSVELPVDVVM